jgi:beta-glucosidase
MGVDDAVSLMSGGGFWSTRGMPPLGLRPLLLSDGPSGVRGRHWNESDPSVCVPAPVALAATWDEELVTRVAELLAGEARPQGRRRRTGSHVNL